MSAPHPLNQAVIAQALHDLRNGQLRRCKAMGFGDRELDALKHPELVSMLVNATVSWCSVKVNREVLQRLLHQVEDVEKEIATVDRMLRLGASTEMVSKFYGLTHQEVALRRDVLGLPKRKGRHPVLSEEQDTGLWGVGSPPSSNAASHWTTTWRCSISPSILPKNSPCRPPSSGRRFAAGSIRDWCRPWRSTSLIRRRSGLALRPAG